MANSGRTCGCVHSQRSAPPESSVRLMCPDKEVTIDFFRVYDENKSTARGGVIEA
jgi:hypothetical protein